MSTRNKVAVATIFLSYVLLYFGLTHDLMTIRATMSFMGNTTELFTETRSILGTLEGLHDSRNDFVAGLITLFGVVIPIAKGLMLLAALLMPETPLRRKMLMFVRAISKWAMNDVFVVAVFVAYLAARATDNLDAVIHDETGEIDF